MIDEVTHDSAAKVHLHFDVGVGADRIPIPNLMRVIELLLVLGNLHAVFFFDEKMYLVNMEFVDLGCAVLNCPFFDRTPVCRDRRRIVRVVKLVKLPIDRDVKVDRFRSASFARRARRRFSVGAEDRRYFDEVQQALRRQSPSHRKMLKALAMRGAAALGRSRKPARTIGRLDVGIGALRIAV